MYIAIFLILLFFDVVEAHVPYFNYWDELSTCLVMCWGGYSLWKNPSLSKWERTNWLLLIVLVAIGALGNVFHPGLQPNFITKIKDIVAVCKFPVIFFVMQRRVVAEEEQKKIVTTCAKISRWIVVVTVFCVFLGQLVDLGFYISEVRIVQTFEFVFSHPTFFISSYVMIAAILIAESVSKNRIYLLLDCFLIFMAQRTKGYIFIVFLLLIILLGEDLVTRILTTLLGSDERKVNPLRVVLAVALLSMAILIVGRDRLENVISYGLTVPRTVLHVVGIRIMLDFFPLGSGLGTFASHLSARHYSNLYDLYGIADVAGMTREKYNFIGDVFWPNIYGQFGIFGLLVYVKVMTGIFFRQYRSKLTNGARIAMVAVWIYSLIASTAEAYFTSGTGVQMALLLTIFIGYGSRRPEAVTD